jgi:hypothetical protein
MYQESLPFDEEVATEDAISLARILPMRVNPKAISMAARNIELSNIWKGIPNSGHLQFFGDSGYFVATDYARVHCTECGFGDHHDYSGKYHNISRLGKGCPICSVTGPALKKARAFWQSASIEVEFLDDKPIGLKSILYRIKWITSRYEPRHDELVVTHEQLKNGLKAKTPIRNFFANRGIRKRYENVDSVLTEFRELFKRGRIQVTHNLAEPLYTYDTGNDRSAARKRVFIKDVTEKEVNAIIREELEGHSTVIGYRKNFEGQQAKFLGVCRQYVGKELKLKVIYLNYKKDLRIETITRVGEFNFGKTHLRKGETLCYLCVKALFPSGQWIRTGRPEFLRLDNGSKLELDINSDVLRLAFEYQGPHHYYQIGETEEALINFKTQQRHDAIKRERCANHPDGPYQLIEVKDESNGHQLTPETMLRTIKAHLAEKGIRPEVEEPSIEAIEADYLDYFEQPHREFQETVRENLGVHELLGCTVEELYPGKRIVTRCTACDKIQPETNSGAFYSRGVRLDCKSCNGKARHGKLRISEIDRCIKSGKLNEKYRDSFTLGSNGKRQFVCLKNSEHTQSIHRAFEKWLDINSTNGEITCIRCANEQSGIHVSRVRREEQEKASFIENADIMGFDTDETTFKYENFFEKNTLCATVSCQQDSGHQFKSGLSLLNRLSKLRRKEVRPSGFACPACNPDTECSVAEVKPKFSKKRSKIVSGVAIKNEIIQAMYPNAQLIYAGNAREEESIGWCGHSHPDGTPHAFFAFKFHNLQKRAKRRPDAHMCFTCGYLADQAGGQGYSLAQVEDLARADQHRLAALGLKFDFDVEVLEISNPPTSNPAVKLTKAGTPCKPEQWYSFWCGQEGHEPVQTTKSNFFNKSSGGRWCKECLKSLGLKKLPPRNADGSESEKHGQLKRIAVVKSSPRKKKA